MNFTHLGRTGLSVSRLCLGTMNFGPETDEADSFAIMDRAHDVGINFFDTANVYGRSKGGARPRRSSVAGSRKATVAGSGRCSPPSSTCDMGELAQRGQGSRRSTSAGPATRR